MSSGLKRYQEAFDYLLDEARQALSASKQYAEYEDWDTANEFMKQNGLLLDLAQVVLDARGIILEKEKSMIENPMVTGEADFLPFELEIDCPKCGGGMAEGDKTYEVDGELMCDQCFDDWRRGLSRDELAERLGVEVRYV